MMTILSDIITQTTASPVRKLPGGLLSGKVRRSAAIAKLPKLKTGDTICLLNLPEGAYLQSVQIAVENLGKTGTCDIGLLAAEGGESDALIQGLVINSKVTPMTDIRFSKRGIETVNAPLWQLAGLAAAPTSPVSLVATITQDTELPGNMVVIAQYTVD